MSLTQARFTAMGSVIGLHMPEGAWCTPAVEAARDVFSRVEAMATRFRADSPLMQLNARLGCWTVVPALLAQLLTLAEECRRASAGLFDPRVLAAVSRAGYPGAEAALSLPEGPGPDPWLEVAAGGDDEHALVRLQWPVDLGGIGKGFACDLAAVRLAALVPAFLLDAGGDMRLWGDGGGPDGAWPVGWEDPRRPGTSMGCLQIRPPCAVATSSTARHPRHLIDPRTGRTADSGLAAVTAVAGTAVAAEVICKQLFVSGKGALVATEDWPAPVWWMDRSGEISGNRAARALWSGKRTLRE